MSRHNEWARRARGPSIGRRRFLAGVGGAALAVPLLSRFGPRALADAGEGPRRIIVMTYQMGTVMQHFAPSATGASFTLPYISAPLAPFQDRCLFVTNVDNEVLTLNGRHEFGHPAKKEAALTGTLLTSAFGGDGTNRVENVLSDGDGTGSASAANGPSVCQRVGRFLRRSDHPQVSIDLAVHGFAEFERDTQASHFFFENGGNPVSLQLNPSRALGRIFENVASTGEEPNPAEVARRTRNGSVLDAVRRSFTELRAGLPERERRRLEEHAERIRQIEIDVQRMGCAPPTGIPGDGTPTASYDPFRYMTMSDLAPLQNSILASAMACDLAPVGRVEYIEGHDPKFGVPEVDDAVDAWQAIDPAAAWHSMVHGDPSPVDDLPTRPDDRVNGTYYQPLLRGYRFFVEQFADLLTRLDSIVEDDDGRTVLDNSLVVLASDFGDGFGHSSRKMAYVLAGNTGSARSGYHIDLSTGPGFYDPTSYNVNHLLASILRIFCVTDDTGNPVTSFGLEGFADGDISPIFG